MNPVPFRLPSKWKRKARLNKKRAFRIIESPVGIKAKS
jgi:hypothetical protein